MEKVSITKSVSFSILHIVWKFQWVRNKNKENSKISIWSPLSGAQIYLLPQIQEGGTFDIAKRKCEDAGASLVQHILPITQDYITNELRRREPSMTTKLLWIGVEKEPSQYTRRWNWVDGGCMAYLNYTAQDFASSLENRRPGVLPNPCYG